MSRYERVIFAEGEDAEEFLDIIGEDGPEAAIEHMSEWHYPGEHETAPAPGHGSDDNVFISDDGYILAWNPRIGYAGLEFDTEAEE